MKSLPRWKQNVMDQTRQPDEIVIVDAFSDDGTYEYLSKWAKTDGRVKLIQEKGAAAHGRNIAIENTIYEHILSTDMGVRLAEVWCEELILLFESDESVEVVAGNTCLDIETIKTNVGWAEFYLENGGFENLKSGHVPGNRSIAYRKNVWKEVNSLPEDLTFYADDSVFGRQLVQGNYKFAFAPNAMTFWGRPQTLNQFFRENFVYGKGDGEAFIKTPRAFKWYHEGKLLKNMVPTCSFIINLLKKNVWKGFFRALSKGKWSVAFLIPILAAGRSYHHSKGYLVGFEKGNISCIECRARLKRDNNGYSIL
jgi:glycosyltransferase involved in cell wall biosynthesis